MKIAISIVLLFCCLFGSFVFGVQSDTAIRESKKNGEKYLTTQSNDPSLSSPNSGPLVQILLESSKLDAKRAKAQIGLQKGDTIINLKLEGPLESGVNQSTWADLNGLANSVVADIGVSDFFWKPKSHGDSLIKAIDQYKNDFIAAGNTPAQWEAMVTEKQGINTDNLPRKYYQKYLKGICGTPVQWGFRFQFGREKYRYLIERVFEDKTVIKTNWAFIWFNGIILPECNLYLGLNYRYQSAYKAKDPQKICLPIGDPSGTLRCYEQSVGEPQKNIGNIGQFEARYFISPQFALNPKFAFDFNAKVLGFELPFYFLKNTEEGLNGGVSVGWRSDTKEWGLRFFVGNAFKIFRD